ncbi:MAG: tRNA pseudouridine synthase B [Syntrophaceae bacterium PtaU1.Bin231]|nr:MAG: tRNA pseudouridine synthase B [Syntrophaceae bacterium PtaU1.Bin231]HOG17811.1 tRNA pseudouridine(55) synthase TruB [Syntrophales bacterium]
MTSGVMVVDKPAGRTSHQTVTEVRRALGVSRAGHTGTLDPLATGVLPVCLNEATKLVQFLSADWKEYRATLLLGVETDTLDTEGRVTARVEPHVGEADIAEVLGGFVGRVVQTPPLISAVKVRGRPLYAWTRKGVAVEPEPRTVEIASLEIERFDLPHVTFKVRCSKGTYVRSLCADAGRLLGCGGCLAELRRTRSGNFDETRALSLHAVGEVGRQGGWGAAVISMVDALPDLARIQISAEDERKAREGRHPSAGMIGRYHLPFLAAGDVIMFVTMDKRLIAIGKMLASSAQVLSMEENRQAVEILRVFNEN